MAIPVLSFIDGSASLDHRLGHGFDALQVVRMDAGAPGSEADRLVVWGVAEHPEIELGASGGALGEVQVPHPPLCTLDGGLEAPLTAQIVEIRRRRLSRSGFLENAGYCAHRAFAGLLQWDEGSGQEAMVLARMARTVEVHPLPGEQPPAKVRA